MSLSGVWEAESQFCTMRCGLELSRQLLYTASMKVTEGHDKVTAIVPLTALVQFAGTRNGREQK